MYHDPKTDPRPKNKDGKNGQHAVAPIPSVSIGSFAALQPPPENLPARQFEVGPEVLAVFLIALYLCFALLPNRSGGFFLSLTN